MTGALNRETRVAGLPSVRRNDPGAGYEREMRRTGVYAGHQAQGRAYLDESIVRVEEGESVRARKKDLNDHRHMDHRLCISIGGR